MAKCPKCQRRKGKRYCPALDESICPTCCAEHRLQTIPCPQDCPHLQSEYYQLERRRERARSAGKRFIESLEEDFFNDAARQFAFDLQADLYWWMRENGPLANGALVKALDEVRGSLGPVVTAVGAPSPLAVYLLRLLETRRYGPTRSFAREHQLRALQALARSVTALEDHEGTSLYERIAAYFDELDFEADLDHSPAELLDEEPPPAQPYRESASGLILPREP